MTVECGLGQKSKQCDPTAERGIICVAAGIPFVPIADTEGSNRYYFIETTLVGRRSFADAVNLGGQEFEEILPELAKDRRDAYFWLDISDVRQEGILPVPWR